MKKINRVMAFMLAGIIGLSCIGCGAKEDTVPGDNSPSVTTDNKADKNPEQEAKKVHIDILRTSLSESSALSEDKLKEVEGAVNEYISDKINVEIGLSEIGSDEYEEKAKAALSDGKTNLIWMNLCDESTKLSDLLGSEEASLMDITEVLKDTVLYKSAPEAMWKASLCGDSHYFVSVFNGNGEGYSFLFRKDIADNFNWSTANIKRPSDVEPMLADAKEEGLVYPFLTQKTATFSKWYIDSFDFFTKEQGTSWIAIDRSTNEVIDTVTTSEYFEFCTLMSFWADEGYISEEDIMKKTSQKTLKSKDWAVSWWDGAVGETEAQKLCNQDVTVIPATGRYLTIDSMAESAYVVSAKSSEEETKACMDFLGLLYTDEKLADIYTYGIEGSDFEYDQQGYVVRLSETYNYSMKNSAAATAVTSEATAPYDKSQVAELNSKAVVSQTNGFSFDKTPVQAEYEACKKVFEQYGFALENGGYTASDVESVIAQYQTALDSAGYQKILDEFTRQYNAWK